MSVGVIVAVIVGAITILGFVSLAVPFTRGRVSAETVRVLREALEVERAERHEQEKRYEREIAHLRGRVDTMTNGFARELARAVAPAIVAALVDAKVLKSEDV